MLISIYIAWIEQLGSYNKADLVMGNRVLGAHRGA